MYRKSIYVEKTNYNYLKMAKNRDFTLILLLQPIFHFASNARQFPCKIFLVKPIDAILMMFDEPLMNTLYFHNFLLKIYFLLIVHSVLITSCKDESSESCHLTIRLFLSKLYRDRLIWGDRGVIGHYLL